MIDRLYRVAYRGAYQMMRVYWAVMRPQVHTIRPEAPALEAMQRMSRNNDGRLLVVDATGRVVGTISNTDLMRAIEGRTPGVSWGVNDGNGSAPRPVVEGSGI